MGTERNPNNLYLWFYILFLKDPLSPSYINFMPHKIVSPWGMCMCVRGELLQSHPTLCDPMVCSPPGFSVHGILQQEYWSGLPCPLPGDLPDPGIELESPVAPEFQEDSLLFFCIGTLPNGKVGLGCHKRARPDLLKTLSLTGEGEGSSQGPPQTVEKEF